MNAGTAQIISLASTVAGALSGLDLTNEGAGNLTVRSFQSAQNETQTFVADNGGAGNVAITTNGSGAGSIILSGRFTLTDSLDITANKALTLQMAANGGGLGLQGAGGVNVLHGTVTITRSGSDTISARALTVGDGSGSAGSAVLKLTQNNMWGSSGGNNSSITVKSDGKLDLSVTANNNWLGTDSTASSQLLLHGGAQVEQVAGGTFFIRGNGSQAVVQVANSGSASVATISGGGTIGLDLSTATSSGTREISVAKNTAAGSADLQISALISDGDDNMTYNKTGAGILEITSNNTSTMDGTGTWNIQAGGLLVNNTTGSATGASTMSVTIGSSASLGGTGTIAGNVTISGAHNPGNSPGVQTFGGNLTYNENATVNWELSSNTITQGTGTLGDPYTFDQIVVGGTLNFAGATTLNLAFNGSGSTVDWTDDTFWGSNRTWLVYDSNTTSNYASLTLSAMNWVDGFGNEFNTERAGSSFSLSLVGQDIFLNYTAAAIPEPSTYAALAGLGALGLVMWKRRRRAQVTTAKSA